MPEVVLTSDKWKIIQYKGHYMIKPFWLPQKFCQRTLGMAVVKVFMLQVQGFYRQGNFPVMLCTVCKLHKSSPFFNKMILFVKLPLHCIQKKIPVLNALEVDM